MTSKVPCKFFMNGCCAFGDGCRFSHDVGGQKLGGRGGGGGAAGGAGREVCKFFLAGNCAYGDACRFEHSGGARRPPPGPHAGGGPDGGGGGGGGMGMPPPPGMMPGGEWSGGVYKWPSGADEFGLMESSDPNPNWDEYMDPDEMEAFEQWQREQLEGGGGEYPEGYDGADLVDPSDIPLCEDYEATGACPGGDDCPLIHGDKCEGCGQFSIHPYNPDLIEAHKKTCKGAAAAAAGNGAAAAGKEEGDSKEEAAAAAVGGGEDEAAAAGGGKDEATAAADALAAGLEATKLDG